MAVPPELVWLIERLRGTRSRRERVRLLLEGRRLLRDLSPTDRLAVARELGFDGAERLVSEVAEKRGFSAEPWLRMLDDVEAGAADEVPGILRGLIDPATRKGSVTRLIDAAGGWVADLDAYRPVPPSPDDVVADEADLDGDPDRTETTAPDHVDEVEAPPQDVDETVPIMPPELDPQPDPEPVETTVEPEPSPRPPVRPEAVEPDAPEPADRPTPPAEPVAEPPTARPTAAGPDEPHEERSVAAVQLEPLTARLAAHNSSSQRLSDLRGSLEGLAGADVEAVKTLLDHFPGGWARRRALEALFRAGLPGSLQGCLDLLEGLGRRSERFWALTTLAASRRLSKLETDALIAAADSPALARRLAHRLRTDE